MYLLEFKRGKDKKKRKKRGSGNLRRNTTILGATAVGGAGALLATKGSRKKSSQKLQEAVNQVIKSETALRKGKLAEDFNKISTAYKNAPADVQASIKNKMWERTKKANRDAFTRNTNLRNLGTAVNAVNALGTGAAGAGAGALIAAKSTKKKKKKRRGRG